MTATTSIAVESRVFEISEFLSKSDNVPKPRKVSWGEICKEVENPVVRRDKDGPLISGAVFDPPVRSKDNVQRISLLGYDVDHNCDLPEIEASVRSLGCAAAVHSTHSHMLRTESNPNAEPRYRILIPLAADLTKEEHAVVYSGVKGRLNLPVDEAPKSTAQMFYKPARASSGVPYVHRIVQGPFLDWRALPVSDLERVGRESAPIRRAEPVGEVINNGARNKTLLSIGGSMRQRGSSIEAIYAALQVENQEKCKPPLDLLEVRQIAESLGRYEPAAALNSLNSLNSQPEKVRIKPILDENALYGPIGDAVRIMAEHTEAAPVAILVQCLSAFGVMVGRGPHFSFGHDRQYTKLNSCLVGPSGRGRKGTSWNDALHFILRVDEGFKKILASGLSSGEGLIHHVRDPQYKQVAVKEKGRLTGEYQEEMTDAGAEDKRAFIHEAEFSRPLKAASREGSTLSEVLRDSFDKDFLSVLTKNATRATDVHVAFVGHITENELRRELDDTAIANGFANRITWIYTEKAQSLPFGGTLEPSSLNECVRGVQLAYQDAKRVGRMYRTARANDLWEVNYERLSDFGEGLVDALLARATTHVMRLACIYALLDRETNIDVQHLQAALALWQYCEDSVRYVWGNSLGDKTADAILKALLERPDGMTRTEISNSLGRHETGAKIANALDRLEKLNKVRIEKIATAGAPATRFFAVGAK